MSNPQPDPPQDHDARVDDFEQPLVAHLIELRQRILKSILAVFIVFFPLYFYANEIYEFVAKPLMDRLPSGSTMIATEVASPFLTPFKLAMWSAVFVAVPYILHQAWSFVAPGLYIREKKFALPLLSSSIVLFYLGIAFAYFVVFPLIFRFMASVTPVGVTMMTDINHYLDFVLKLFFAFGFSFEVPIATLLMVSSRITTVESLTRKRPYIIVGCFVAGMLLTPPDVISQVMLALPIWFLFELGIVFGRVVERRRT